jgi:hypothetical protein
VMEAPLQAPIMLSANTDYWIAAISQTTITVAMTSAAPGLLNSFNTAMWPNFPSTFPSSGSPNNAITPDFYVVLQDL